MDCYLMIAKDKPNSLELRLQTRPEHVEYLNQYPDAVLMGGPLTNEKGEMCGTMLVYNTTAEAEARKLIDNDPYSHAGLFRSVELLPFKWVKNPPQSVK